MGAWEQSSRGKGENRGAGGEMSGKRGETKDMERHRKETEDPLKKYK